eukprot:SAG31_NODE_317_length_17813_cov_5.788585_9_plen_171_part_00
MQNVVTHDCGPRKMPSYLGCEGCYCGNPIDPVSPLAGFARYAGATTHVQGCSIAGNSTEGFAAAKRAASQADETVLIVGLDVTQECEGLDRTTVKVCVCGCFRAVTARAFAQSDAGPFAPLWCKWTNFRFSIIENRSFADARRANSTCARSLCGCEAKALHCIVDGGLCS